MVKERFPIPFAYGCDNQSTSAAGIPSAWRWHASDPTAPWFVELAESQADRTPEAAALWEQLLSELQPDTSAYRAVQARIESLAPTE